MGRRSLMTSQAAAIARGRSHAGYIAFVLHRLSGIVLALYLPLHFWVLALSLNGEARLDEFLRWTDQPLVKFSEWFLISCLALHLAGGVRVMALEVLPWREWQKTLFALALGFCAFAGLAFVLALV